jgi:hypothetical protein
MCTEYKPYVQYLCMRCARLYEMCSVFFIPSDMCSVCHLLNPGVAALFIPDPRPVMFSPFVISIQCATC